MAPSPWWWLVSRGIVHRLLLPCALWPSPDRHSGVALFPAQALAAVLSSLSVLLSG